MSEINSIEEMQQAIIDLTSRVHEFDSWPDIYIALPEQLRTKNMENYLKNIFVIGYLEAVKELMIQGDIK